MAYKRLQVVTFFLILLIAFLVVLFLLKPFASIVAFGLIIAILFEPINSRILARTNSPTLAALITITIILLIALIPLLFFGQLLFNELSSIYERFSSGDLVLNRDQIVQSLPGQLQDVIESFSRDLNSFLGRLTSNAFQSFSSVLSSATGFVVSFFVFLLTLFYLLRDGPRIKQFFTDLMPMAERQENRLIHRIVFAVNGVVKGSFLTAVSQGVMATVGFIIFGVPEPLIWGLFTIIAALVPTVGTALSLVPAVIYLLVTGQTGNAIGLAIWGVLAVGLIDNFLGPRLVGTRTQLHPLLVLLSILGGIELFGILGFLIGPIVMAIFVALVDMYRTDFKSYVEQ